MTVAWRVAGSCPDLHGTGARLCHKRQLSTSNGGRRSRGAQNKRGTVWHSMTYAQSPAPLFLAPARPGTDALLPDSFGEGPSKRFHLRLVKRRQFEETALPFGREMHLDLTTIHPSRLTCHKAGRFAS